MHRACARVLLPVLALIAGTSAVTATQALANGDPASHVLPSGDVFVPFDPSLCSAAARRLDALTAATKKDGYPIKVAVIPTAEDLGTLYQLFGRAEEYARELARELPPNLFRGRANKRYRLLVLMPDSAGLHNAGRAESRAFDRISIEPRDSEQLVRLAIEIVSKVSRAAGHRVGSPKPKPPCPDIDVGSSKSSDSGGSVGSLPIFVAPVVMLALAVFMGSRGRSRRGTS